MSAQPKLSEIRAEFNKANDEDDLDSFFTWLSEKFDEVSTEAYDSGYDDGLGAADEECDREHLDD